MPLETRHIKLTVSYEGTDFHGFQKQEEDIRTVQSEIERALEELLGRKIEIFGASRTDAGVHALGQVVSFDCETGIPPDRIAPALRPLLPPDLGAVCSEEAPAGFHARFSATGKMYCFVINRSRAPMPFLRHAALNVREELDVSRMSAAAKHFIGEHDFSAFRNQGSQPSDPVRILDSFELKEAGPFLIIIVHGSAFLYRMVRNLAGTILEVGRGRIEPDAIPEIIASKDRAAAGPTLQPHGLYLVRVDYD
jgi:tRNA pseudouridine38-40 synthase